MNTLNRREVAELLQKENPHNLSAINWLQGKYLDDKITAEQFEIAFIIYMEQLEDAYTTGFDEAQDGQRLNFKGFCEDYF